jgi:hypothetical protein
MPNIIKIKGDNIPTIIKRKKYPNNTPTAK